MAETATRAMLRGLHLQVMSAQAQLAALDHSLREMLSDSSNGTTATPPAKVAAVSEELRSLLGKPTLEEARKNVFMRGAGADAVTDSHTDPKPQASGTPSGDTPSVPSD